MSRWQSFRLNRNTSITRCGPAPTAKRAHRLLTSYAAEQRGRRRGERSNSTGTHMVAAPDDPIVVPTNHHNQRPTYHIGGFSFDPFPPMLFPARSPNSRIAEAEIINDRRRNFEEGRSLILKFGSADSASSALRTAYSLLRVEVQRRNDMFNRVRWNPAVLHEEWRNRSHVPGYSISLARQLVGISEAAFVQKTGVTLAHAAFTLNLRSKWLSQLEFMYPFGVQLEVQGVLYRFLGVVRTKSVQEFGTIGMRLHDEQKKMVENFARWRTSNLERSQPFYERYESIKNSAYELFTDIGATDIALFKQCSELVDLNAASSRSWDSRRRPFWTALREYKNATMTTREFLTNSTVEVFTIQLRRQSLRDGVQQHVYSALHHHFKRTRALSQHFTRQTKRSYVGLAREAAIFDRRTGKREARCALLRYQPMFVDAVDKFEFGMQEIMEFYHEELLPLWTSSIRLMSSSELIRQDRVAQNYWLKRFRSDHESESRLAQLEAIRVPIAIARHVSRTGEKADFDTRRLHKRALVAIARLSELYRTQYQGDAKSRAQCPRNVLPQGGAPSSVMPDARKPVRWQTYHRSTTTRAPDVSAKIRSSERLSPSEPKSRSTSRINNDLVPLDDVQASSPQAPQANLIRKHWSLPNKEAAAREARHTLQHLSYVKPPLAKERQNKPRAKLGDEGLLHFEVFDNSRIRKVHKPAPMHGSQSRKPAPTG